MATIMNGAAYIGIDRREGRGAGIGNALARRLAAALDRVVSVYRLLLAAVLDAQIESTGPQRRSELAAHWRQQMVQASADRQTVAMLRAWADAATRS